MLIMENVCKDYITEKGQVIKALDKFNLQIMKNDFIAVLGPSGCGKSTLLRIVAGLESSSTGKIYYKGSIMQNNNRQNSHREISMVFQDYSLLPWRTVLDNVTLGLEFAGINTRKRQQKGREFLQLVGLEQYAHAYPYELSGGMQQRVAIVRSLATEPQLLLMDEPFGALDAHTRMVLQQELLHIWQKTKKTVLFITHSVDEAIYLADKIIVMSSSPGTIKEVINVEMPRPRNRANPKYGKLLTYLFETLGEEGNSGQSMQIRKLS